MSLTARERRTLAELERQFQPRRRRSVRPHTVLAIGWLMFGLLFAALMTGSWVLAAIAGAMGAALVAWQAARARA